MTKLVTITFDSLPQMPFKQTQPDLILKTSAAVKKNSLLVPLFFLFDPASKEQKHTKYD